MYKPIEVDRERLTIMGVPFPDMETLESAAAAIGSQMFEGYEPTANGVAVFRDLMLKKLTPAQFIQTVKAGFYAQ
jgi:putative transcriptional regulator